MDMASEMMGDAVDDALDDDEVEDETDDLMNQVNARFLNTLARSLAAPEYDEACFACTAAKPVVDVVLGWTPCHYTSLFLIAQMLLI